MLDTKRELTADAVSVRNTKTVASIRIRLLYNFTVIYNGIRILKIWVIFEHAQTVDTGLSFSPPIPQESLGMDFATHNGDVALRVRVNYVGHAFRISSV